MRKRLLYAESPKWATLIEGADELMRSPAFRPVKAEGRTLAGFVTCPDGSTVFLKRSAARGWIAGLCDRVRGSRAARSIRGARTVREAGFRCAAPLAAMDVLKAGAVYESYLLSEALERAQILSHFALGRAGGERRGYARRKAVSDALATELRRLHDCGVYSEDLQETNLMVEQRAGAIVIYFLDLEDFRRARSVSWRRRMRNLVHLDRSIGRFVCRAGRLDFLYAYTGARLERRARRKLVSGYLQLRESVEREHRRRQRRCEPAVTGAHA